MPPYVTVNVVLPGLASTMMRRIPGLPMRLRARADAADRFALYRCWGAAHGHRITWAGDIARFIASFDGEGVRRFRSIGESKAVFLRGVGGDAVTEPRRTGFGGIRKGIPKRNFGTHKIEMGSRSTGRTDRICLRKQQGAKHGRQIDRPVFLTRVHEYYRRFLLP